MLAACSVWAALLILARCVFALDGLLGLRPTLYSARRGGRSACLRVLLVSSRPATAEVAPFVCFLLSLM